MLISSFLKPEFDGPFSNRLLFVPVRGENELNREGVASLLKKAASNVTGFPHSLPIQVQEAGCRALLQSGTQFVIACHDVRSRLVSVWLCWNR